MVSMTSAVACPFCENELYTVHQIPGGSSKLAPEAKIQSDKVGTFMDCPSCNARVAFERQHGTMVVADKPA